MIKIYNTEAHSQAVMQTNGIQCNTKTRHALSYSWAVIKILGAWPKFSLKHNKSQGSRRPGCKIMGAGIKLWKVHQKVYVRTIFTSGATSVQAKLNDISKTFMWCPWPLLRRKIIAWEAEVNRTSTWCLYFTLLPCVTQRSNWIHTYTCAEDKKLTLYLLSQGLRLEHVKVEDGSSTKS